MAVERSWEYISPRAFTDDGQANGVVTVESTSDFRVKQTVIVTSLTLESTKVEVKRVLSSTQMILGPVGGNIKARTNLSAYIMLHSPTVHAPEQPKNKVPTDDQNDASYEREPVVARRVFSVDEFGKSYNQDNPFKTEDIGQSAREAAVLANLKTLEMFGIPLDDYVLADDEIVTLEDGTLIKAGE